MEQIIKVNIVVCVFGLITSYVAHASVAGSKSQTIAPAVISQSEKSAASPSGNTIERNVQSIRPFSSPSKVQDEYGNRHALASNSDSNWSDLFGPAGVDDNSGTSILALASFDSKLVVAGSFGQGHGGPHYNVIRLATWNGNAWDKLSIDSPNGLVRALAVYNGELIIGGDFTTIGGDTMLHVARWNGAAWQRLEVSGPNSEVDALAVYGGKLYVGGKFTDIGGTPFNHIAMWDSTGHWAQVGGSGTNGEVNALTVYAGWLFIGGGFTSAGGTAMSSVGGYGKIARWDGSSFAKVGEGLSSAVHALTTNSGKLYLGGEFTSAASPPSPPSTLNYIASWDTLSGFQSVGSSTALSGASAKVKALTSWNGSVIAGGSFTISGASVSNLASFASGTWSAIGGSPNGEINAVLPFDSSTLIAGGTFQSIASTGLDCIGRWSSSAWSPLGFGVNQIPSTTKVIGFCADGTDVIAVGKFGEIGGTNARNISRWNGSSWTALGSGLGTTGTEVRTAVKLGSDLFAGGTFTTPNLIAKWSGASWAGLSSAITTGSVVNTMIVNGSDLIVGGNFTNPADNASHNIARYSGGWYAYGDITAGPVTSLAIYNGVVYAAAGSEVWSYNGSSWTSISGLHMNGTVYTLAVMGGALYVGGAFTDVNGASSNTYKRVVGWNGSRFTVGSGLDNTVTQLCSYNCDLVAIGIFAQSGVGTPFSALARFDGSDWVAMASTSPYGLSDYAFGLLASNHDLWVGGEFSRAGNKLAFNVARYTEPFTGVDQVVDLAASTGRHTMTLTWSTPGPTTPDCSRARYELRWRTDGAVTESNFADSDPLDAGDPGAVDDPHCFDLAGLDVCTWYYFGIKIFDSGGFSSPLMAISAKTLCSGNLESYPCSSRPGDDELVTEPESDLELGVVNSPEGSVGIRLYVPTGLGGQRGTLTVFDIAGRRVRSIQSEVLKPGPIALDWDRINDNGAIVPRGIYFVRLVIGDRALSRRVLLLR